MKSHRINVNTGKSNVKIVAASRPKSCIKLTEGEQR